MPLYRADALVLRTYKLGEADRIVVFLTRDRGKKRGVARGARKSVRRFGGALEPLTRVRVSYFERESRDLVRLDFADPVASPLSARQPEALGYVGYFAELIDAWAPDNDANEALFRLGCAVVEALASGAPVDRLVRYVEYWVLRLQGVYPSIAACPVCGGVLGAGGAVLDRDHLHLVCRSCGTAGAGPGLGVAALRFLQRAATRAPADLDAVPLGASAAREIEQVHRRLIALHLDREPRSGRVLREMGM